MTTVTLGLDGGSFELIEPWIDEGGLPNIDRICTDGAAGDMQSCIPPVTCPNWRCYATGWNPGKLGVFWWEAINRSQKEISNTSSRNCFDGQPFWEQMDDEVAIINLPTSYPPPSVNGIHVAGGPGAEQIGFTHPEPLEQNLRETYEYQVHPEKLSLLSSEDPNSPCIDEIYRLIDQRFELLLDELSSGNYEFIHLTVFYLNVLQHFYWDHEVVKKAWQRIDEWIGELLDADELGTLFVMSDHGSNEIRIEFRVNTWLEEEGYLVTEESGSDWLSRLGITRERVRPILGSLGVEWWLRRIVPENVQDMLPSNDGRIKKSGKAKVIDWKQSTAVASGQGPVYILTEDPTERKQIRDELLAALGGLTDDTGTQIIREAVRASAVYEGPHVSDGPDILLRQAPNIHIDGSIGAGSVFGEPETWRGENKETGFFIAYGDQMSTNDFPDGMHILDVAPTILHLHGYPIPSSLDGAVQTELFTLRSDASKRDPEWIDDQDRIKSDTSSNTSDMVDDRLKDLGYL